jgi:hypothetical protein
MQPPKYDTLTKELAARLTWAHTHTPNLVHEPRKARWLSSANLSETLRHQYETPRAVRRRLGLSARQYKKRLKAHKRTGYLPQAFMRRQVG